MWNSKQDMIDPEKLIIRLFKPKGTKIRDQYVRLYRFRVFLAAFLVFSFSYISSMPKINIIDYKTEGKTDAYAFAPSMFNESSLSGNQSVFEDFNVIQMGINKTDSQ